MRKTVLVVTDVGLVIYWTLTATGLISVGGGAMLSAWNWSFLPLDVLAAATGLVWSVLPKNHPFAGVLFGIALGLTHAAGLVALSFFALWGEWDASWWIVNLWLALVPIGLAISALRSAPRSQALVVSLPSP